MERQLVRFLSNKKISEQNFDNILVPFMNLPKKDKTDNMTVLTEEEKERLKKKHNHKKTHRAPKQFERKDFDKVAPQLVEDSGAIGESILGLGQCFKKTA